jgi:hypothetical protein
VLNLAVAEDNKVYWWVSSEANAKVVDLSKDGLRKLLIEKQKANPKIVLLIKPKDTSKYASLVDVLDEVMIVGMTRYFLIDFGPDDQKIIDNSLVADVPQ